MLFNVVDAIFIDSYFEKKQIFVYLLFIRSGGCIMTKNDDYRALIWEFLILRKTHVCIFFFLSQGSGRTTMSKRLKLCQKRNAMLFQLSQFSKENEICSNSHRQHKY